MSDVPAAMDSANSNPVTNCELTSPGSAYVPAGSVPHTVKSSRSGVGAYCTPLWSNKS